MKTTIHRLMAGLLATLALGCLSGCKPSPSQEYLQKSNQHLSATVAHLQQVGRNPDSEIRAAKEAATFLDQLRQFPVPFLRDLSEESKFASWSNQFAQTYSQKRVAITNEIARIKKQYIEKPEHFIYHRPSDELDRAFPQYQSSRPSSMPSLTTNAEEDLFFLLPSGHTAPGEIRFANSPPEYFKIAIITEFDMEAWFKEVKEMSAKWSPSALANPPQTKKTN